MIRSVAFSDSGPTEVVQAAVWQSTTMSRSANCSMPVSVANWSTSAASASMLFVAIAFWMRFARSAGLSADAGAASRASTGTTRADSGIDGFSCPGKRGGAVMFAGSSPLTTRASGAS